MVIENEVNLDMELSQLCHVMSWRLFPMDFSIPLVPLRLLEQSESWQMLTYLTCRHASTCLRLLLLWVSLFSAFVKSNKHNHCSEVQAYE